MDDLDQRIADLERQLAELKQRRAAQGSRPPSASSARPLQGIRVVDMSRFLVGPFGAQMLADMGAEVIKIETLPGGDPMRAAGSKDWGGENLFFLARNRNKHSLAVDIRQDAGREVLYRLVRTADVFVENFRPGAADKLGVGYERLSRENPQLLYCAVSGYGQEGPERERPGQDLLIQAFSGLVSITGWDDGRPTTVGTLVADMVGAFHCAYGIAIALLGRERLGIGQKIELSLLDSLLALQAMEATTYLNTGIPPKKAGAGHGIAPAPYRIFEAQGGAFALVAASQAWWQRLGKIPELRDICADPRFASRESRGLHADALHALLEERFRDKPAADWLARFAEYDVLAAPVQTYAEVFSDPQVVHNGMIISQQHPRAGAIRTLGIPIKLSRTPGHTGAPAPLLGQHTEAVLAGLGYSQAEVERLRAAGVVVQAEPETDRTES